MRNVSISEQRKVCLSAEAKDGVKRDPLSGRMGDTDTQASRFLADLGSQCHRLVTA